MNDFLILAESPNPGLVYDEWLKNGIKASFIFKKQCLPVRALRRYWIKLHLPLQRIWYLDFRRQIRTSKIIIVHVCSLNLDMIPFINRINPAAKVIAWYWNKAGESIAPRKVKGKCELWSFDPEDCKKYSMKFNHQYYFRSLIINDRPQTHDLYFCGADVGRGKKLTEIYNYLKGEGLDPLFRVVSPEYSDMPREMISGRVDYDTIREETASSGAILEIVRSGQSGATLRTMEAIFFQKKLITDNKYVKDEVFYDENRIFILGERSLDELGSFLRSEFVPYEEELIDRYDVTGWLENFRKG